MTATDDLDHHTTPSHDRLVAAGRFEGEGKPMIAINLDKLMREVEHFAETVAMLHKFEASNEMDAAEHAAKWRVFADRRHAEIEATVYALATNP